MSELAGPAVCPRCRCDEFRMEDWTTYTSVLCRGCGAKAGELSNTFSSAPDPVVHPLLGRLVEVVLNRDAPTVIVARGRLLRYSAMGECVLEEEDGDVHWCWPRLDIRPAEGGADGVSDHD